MQGSQGSQKNADLEIGSCPFSEAMKAKGAQPAEGQKCPFQGVKVDAEPKKKKEKKQRGGCPFMQDEKKRNPPLAHLEESFDTYYVSPQNYLLDTRGMWMLAFDAKQAKKGPIKDRRKQFDSYPIYLKSTLLHDEENTKKLRTLEVANRFFVYDKFREKGNKLMNKKEYDEAIKYYERALGCFKWLEVIDLPESDSDTEDPVLDPSMTEQEQKEYMENREAVRQQKREQREFKKQYKSMMTVYTDENVKLRSPDDLEDAADKEMSNSMLFSLYLNMGVCYMNLSHFNLARKVLEDASKISADNSQLVFRQAQAILYDKWSTYKDLLKCKQLAEKCLDLSNYEKIFKQEPGILRLMGLTNAKEMYLEQMHKVMDKLKSKKKEITDIVEPLILRALEIDEIEKEMIEDGKVPYEEGVTDVVDPELPENPEETPKERLYKLVAPQYTEEHQEYEIVKEMVNKYYRIIEFYAEQRKPDQVNIAKKELQRLSETVNLMHFYMNLDWVDWENDEILKELILKHKLQIDKKIVRRLHRLCREQITEIFGQGKFNFEVFEYAMTDYFKKKREEQDKKDQEELDRNPVPIKPQSQFMQKTFYSGEFWMQMVILLFVMGGMYFFNSSTGLIGSLFSLQKS